jgi:hypothetical protein
VARLSGEKMKIASTPLPALRNDLRQLISTE